MLCQHGSRQIGAAPALRGRLIEDPPGQGGEGRAQGQGAVAVSGLYAVDDIERAVYEDPGPDPLGGGVDGQADGARDIVHAVCTQGVGRRGGRCESGKRGG